MEPVDFQIACMEFKEIESDLSADLFISIEI